MKGWVYVISNESMPDLIKVGYTSKDPELRANDLNHTGAPNPYIVDYDILVDEPYQIEQRVHKRLASFNEGKEWFRCSLEKAIATIQSESIGVTHNENYKKAKVDKILEIRKKDEIDKEISNENNRKMRLFKKWSNPNGKQRKLEGETLSGKYFDKIFKLEASFKEQETPFHNYWIGISISLAILFGMSSDDMSGSEILTSSVMLGGMFALMWVSLFADSPEKKMMQSDAYAKLITKKNEEIQNLENQYPPRDIEVKILESSQENLKNITGKAGIATVENGSIFSGTLKNNNKSWIFTFVIIRVFDEKDSFDSSFEIPIYIRPGNSAEFSFRLQVTPNKVAWSIAAAYGFHED